MKTVFLKCHSRWSGFYIIGSCPGLVWSLLAGWGSSEEKMLASPFRKHFLCSSFRYVTMMCATHPNIVQIIEVFANSVQFPHESSPKVRLHRVTVTCSTSPWVSQGLVASPLLCSLSLPSLPSFVLSSLLYFLFWIFSNILWKNYILNPKCPSLILSIY